MLLSGEHEDCEDERCSAERFEEDALSDRNAGLEGDTRSADSAWGHGRRLMKYRIQPDDAHSRSVMRRAWEEASAQ